MAQSSEALVYPEGKRARTAPLDMESVGADSFTNDTLPHGDDHTARETGWAIRDINWRFVFKAQHYGTIIWGILIAIGLAIAHWSMTPRLTPFLTYDATISYINKNGDTVPSSAAVLVPFATLIITLIFYEFFVFRSENKTITHAAATFVHFLADALCAFVSVVFITELTKFLVGRLRPDFLQFCGPPGFPGSTPTVALAGSSSIPCTIDNLDARKSFPSGHASSSSVTMVYSIVYNLWAGYFRGGDASFMGLNRHSGWRGGRRILRELGHGTYLAWMIVQFGYTWGVGASRITDNKHNPSDVVAGWFLGSVIAMIYAIRAAAIHKYVALDFVQ